MADGLEYYFRLVDNLSGPAKAMEKATRGVETALDAADQQLKDVDKSAKELEKQLRDLEEQAKKTRLEKTVDPLKKQRLELQLNRLALRGQREAALRSRDALRHQRSELQQAQKAMKGYTIGADIMSGVIQQAIGGVIGLGAKALGAGVAGAKFATEAIAFKEQTLTALKVMLGTEESAQRVFAQALDFAKKTPFDTKDVLTGFSQLLGAGFKESEVATVFGAVGDAAAASGFDGQVIDRLVTAFAQIRAKGRLMGQEMLQLNEALGKAGVGTMAIYDQIGKKMGKTRNEVIALQEKGLVDADSAIYGVIKTLEVKSGGAVGNLMAQQSKTFTGLMSTLGSVPGDFFMSLDMRDLPGFAAIKGFVENLVKLFDEGTKTSERFMQVAGKLYNTVMVPLFGDLGSANGMKTMERYLLRGADAIEKMLPSLRNGLMLVKGFASGFGSGLMAGLERYAGVSKLLGDSVDPKLVEEFGQTLGKLASRIFGVADAVLYLLQPLVKLSEFFGNDAKPVLDANAAEKQGFSWGASLTAGLRNGIMQNLTGPVNATDLLVAVIKGGYEKGTETHSPSRLFARYGAWATEGWALGMTGALGEAESAVGELVSVGEESAAAVPGAVGGGAGGVAVGRLGMGGGINVHVTVPLQVMGEGGASAGEQVKEYLLRVLTEELPGALEQAFSQAAVQEGAA
ncbi:hypothetical protein [Myxococcus phage Mx4 ts27htf-1hrm-1]|nr:hypothetical protein [Myxococcus phage Mx4 ts27htf-1hrm-1]